MQCYRPVHPVKALTFDLDDTLYNNEPIIQHADAALNQKIRNDYPALSAMTNDDWFTIKKALINKNPKLVSDMGKLRWQTLFTALGKAQLPDTERAQAASELFDFFYAARSDFQVEPDIIAVMEKLAEKVPLVAITNGNVDTDMIGLAPFFSLTLHASVTRPRKPYPDMFEEAIEHLSLPPQHIMHVGDNLIKDVLGAHKVGMQTAWLACNREMDLRAEKLAILPGVQLSSLDELLLMVD